MSQPLAVNRETPTTGVMHGPLSIETLRKRVYTCVDAGVGSRPIIFDLTQNVSYWCKGSLNAVFSRLLKTGCSFCCFM